MKTNKKTKSLILYLISSKPNMSITALMKLIYLVDLISVRERKKQVSNFSYIRYNFGPFNKGIYSYIEELSESGLIESFNNYTQGDEEYVVYNVNRKKDERFNFDLLSEEEMKIVDELLESVKGFGARLLTEVSYKTKPMKSLGAKINNSKGIGEKLDLSLVNK